MRVTSRRQSLAEPSTSWLEIMAFGLCQPSYCMMGFKFSRRKSHAGGYNFLLDKLSMYNTKFKESTEYSASSQYLPCQLHPCRIWVLFPFNHRWFRSNSNTCIRHKLKIDAYHQISSLIPAEVQMEPSLSFILDYLTRFGATSSSPQLYLEWQKQNTAWLLLI